MRNEIAERMLSQVAPPEQTGTIVGDLLEEQLGPIAFWIAVLRAVVSIARYQPRRTLKSLADVAFYVMVSILFVWLLLRYGGQSLWSASSLLIFNEILAFWRSRRKRLAEARKIA